MHQTNMFNRQPLQPQIELYDLNQIGPQFAGWTFQVGQPFDQMTPQLALMTINEIQQRAAQGHPLRVGMFNIISENAFNNPLFQDLLQTIVIRMGYGVQSGEFRNMDSAAKECITRGVKCCGSALAADDPEFMAGLTPQDAAAVRENAEIWNYLIALAQGQAQYVPFAQMGSSGSGLSGVSGATQQAMSAARTVPGVGGGYVDTPSYEGGVTTSRYNNDAGRTRGRYGRRAEKLLGKLEGPMHQALGEAMEQQQQPVATGYTSRLKRPFAAHAAAQAQGTVDPQAAEAARQFDSNVTDFSKPIAETPVPVPAAAPEKAMFTVQIEDETVKVMRKVPEGVKLWKPSRLQRFHPAWCTRTHRVLYFETSDGLVLAMLQPLEAKEKEIAMKYEAHAIDPSKGQPDPEVPQRPVRKEAAVLYTDSKSVKINISVAPHFTTEEDVSGAIRTTRLTAEMSETVPDAFVKMSIVNSPVIYTSPEEAADDLIVIKAIAGSKDFAEAAGYIGKIRSDLARKTISEALVQAVNRSTECELGVGVRISDFEEDGPEIIGVLERTQGALIGEKMAAHQTVLLKTNVRVMPATEMVGYANATLSTGEEEELSEGVLKRVLFLQHNVCAVWVNFTDDELAVGVPPKGPATIQADSLGALHEIARSTFEHTNGTTGFSEFYLVTKDNARYRLHRGLLNRDCYLLSKEVKAA